MPLPASEDWNPITGIGFEWRQVPTTCFNPDSAVVRVEAYLGGYSLIFDGIVQAQGRYIPRDVWLRDGDLPLAHLTLTVLEFPSKFDGSIFKAPASAKALPPDHRFVAGRRIGGRAPIYPSAAKSQRVQGLVIIAGTISTTGDVSDLQVISGPKELRSSALDAVKTWKFQPFRSDGKPIVVHTAFKIIFNFGA